MDQRKRRKLGLLLYLGFVLVFLGVYLAVVSYQLTHHVRKEVIAGGES